MLRGESCGGSPVVLRSGSDAASCRCLASTSDVRAALPSLLLSCGVMEASDATLLEVRGMTSRDGEGDTRCSAAAALNFGGVDRACERPVWNSAFLSAFLSTGDGSLVSIGGVRRGPGQPDKGFVASCMSSKER